MLKDYHFWFTATSLIIAAILYFRVRRLSKWQLFSPLLSALYFLCFALILFPKQISVKWIEFAAALIVVASAIIILSDFISEAFFGLKRFLRSESKSLPAYIAEICSALEILAARKLGATIVIERKDSLEGLLSGGISFDAQIKPEILAALFEKNSSVHDGAIVVRQGRIAKVKAILPISPRENLGLNLGTRHRSVVGVTEKSDAISFVVSEERGELSVAYRGHLMKADSGKELLRLAAMAYRKQIFKGK